MWLLAEPEINKLMEAADDLDVDWPPIIARAQLKKVAFSLHSPCTEHHDDGTYMIDCEQCLDGLVEEAGI